MMYSDAYLNHYADRYVTLNLRDAGVSLEQYLARPDWFAGRLARLLPQQMPAAGVAARAPQAPATAIYRNGAYIEPLHHRRAPPNHGARRAVFRARAGQERRA